ncbi:MAG: hypothetical protein K9M80_05235 [Candidatus Marinimicrobia bacterium]|nr:hypothetical protein [Candidatus Neomarinimicrobiota bacterium]
MNKIKTEISKAYWCTRNTEGEINFEPARISIGSQNARIFSWFDELFKDGINSITTDSESNEKDINYPLTFLITGPPGSGKSTLSLELCYRLAEKDDNFLSLYISSDAEAEQVKKNAISLGWENAAAKICTFKGREPDLAENGMVAIWGKEQIKKWEGITQIIENALESLIKSINVEGISAKPFWKPFKKLFSKIKLLLKTNVIISPDILVVDNLNIVETQEQGEFFEKYLKTAKKSKVKKIIFFVLDSGCEERKHKFWEYICDVVIRLDHTDIHNYYLRTIQIHKARYQEHIWGKHQLKIYPKYQEEEKHHRDHPYREEGGIFIYPSVHYYLSLYKKINPLQTTELVETRPKELNEILKDPKKSIQNKGLPKGRCTAFMGTRGGHKSHLGYLHILHRIIKKNGNGLIVSLRADERMTRHTMRGIVENDFGGFEHTNFDSISALENNGRLEILYYPPGYITPEEFIHRMFLSIQKFKNINEDRDLTVLFDGLDQLNARFPLCANQEIFIPTIIEILTAEEITSIFTAVEEPGQPVEQYGLIPMADLILSFQHYRFKFENYYKYLDRVWDFNSYPLDKKDRINKIAKNSEGTYREEIVVKILRFAGGQRAGAKGILELVNDIDKSLYRREHNNPGLFFTKLPPSFKGLNRHKSIYLGNS